MPDGFAPFSTQFNQQNLLQALLHSNAQPQNGQQTVDSHMQAAISQEQQQKEQEAAAQALAEMAAPNGTQEIPQTTDAQPSQEQQNAQIQQAAQEAAGLLGATPTTDSAAGATQPVQAQNLAQGLLGPYAADTPTKRAFDAQLYDSVVQPQMDAALLPYREAQYAANDAAIRRAHPDTVMGAKRQLVEGLSQAKAAYDNAKAAGNEKGMNLAHQAAEQLRAQAQAIGLDLGDYGGNEDTNAMVQALANNDARAYASIIDNDMAPEQYYQQLYNRARNSGMSRKESEGYAQAHTEQYQAERNARMQSAFYTYGIQNGAITPYGMQILTKWAAGEDPQAFLGITTKAFGLPIDEYKLGNQRTLLADQNKNTMEQNLQKHGFAMDENAQNAQLRAYLDQFKYAHDDELEDRKYGHTRALKAEFGNGNGGGGSRSGGSNSDSGSGKVTYKDKEWANKLLTKKDLAYQSMGTTYNPGTTFTDPDDHHVEEYRQALWDFLESGTPDEEDRATAQRELDRLSNYFNAVQTAYQATVKE